LILDPELVREEAVAFASSLAEAQGQAFERFRSFLVDEPNMETLPVRFLPSRAYGFVTRDALHDVAVAGKLVYAQIRWLDDVADGPSPVGEGWSSLHHLNTALTDLIRTTFTKALGPSKAGPFLAVLAVLYARYAASLAADNGFRRAGHGSVSYEIYVDHARARAAPVLAPVEAVLLLAEASEDETHKARHCLESCAAGLQLYDDALDIEEDFESGRMSWVVGETLWAIRERHDDRSPDADAFYRTALISGCLSRNLTAAETLFEEAISLAEPEFPLFTEYVRAELHNARGFREDLKELTASARQA